MLAVYEKTVLNAVAEVRNALSDYGQERQRRRSLEEGSLAARRALELAEDRYRQGLSDFGDVLAAQGALLSLEDGLESNAGSLTAALIRLYKALGGGWVLLSEINRNKVKNSVSIPAFGDFQYIFANSQIRRFFIFGG